MEVAGSLKGLLDEARPVFDRAVHAPAVHEIELAGVGPVGLDIIDLEPYVRGHPNKWTSTQARPPGFGEAHHRGWIGLRSLPMICKAQGMSITAIWVRDEAREDPTSQCSNLSPIHNGCISMIVRDL